MVEVVVLLGVMVLVMSCGMRGWGSIIAGVDRSMRAWRAACVVREYLARSSLGERVVLSEMLPPARERVIADPVVGGVVWVVVWVDGRRYVSLRRSG